MLEAVLLAAGLVAGVTGAWSPCGFSMVDTLAPDGYAGRLRATLPAAPRSGVCKAVGRDYRIKVQIDGAWYRCCGGRVRKLVDCCSRNRKRINGDASLTGYCYKGRRVFCVMYYQTKIPC